MIFIYLFIGVNMINTLLTLLSLPLAHFQSGIELITC